MFDRLWHLRFRQVTIWMVSKLSILAKRQLFQPFGQRDSQIKLYLDEGVKLNGLFLLWNNENNVPLCERVWVDYYVKSIATKHYVWF